MIGAIVSTLQHLDNITELEEPEKHEVLTSAGPATVTIGQSIFFTIPQAGTEWYVVREKTEKSVIVEIVDPDGRITRHQDPLFVCQLIAVTKGQKENPTYQICNLGEEGFLALPVELGDTILLQGSLIAAKALADRSARKPPGGSTPSARPPLIQNRPKPGRFFR